jgi:hypothetical protein
MHKGMSLVDYFKSETSRSKAEMTRRDLEHLALAAHARDERWATFWPTVAADVAAIEPYDRDAYRRLVNRLSHLLTCGDVDGLVPVGDWFTDDVQSVPLVVDDVTTNARCLWAPEVSP